MAPLNSILKADLENGGRKSLEKWCNIGQIIVISRCLHKAHQSFFYNLKLGKTSVEMYTGWWQAMEMYIFFLKKKEKHHKWNFVPICPHDCRKIKQLASWISVLW